MLNKKAVKVDENGIYYYGDYHPYRIHGERNPEFDRFSGEILDLKNREKDWESNFSEILNDVLDDNENIVFLCVPSHTELTWGSCADIISLVCKNRRMTDGSKFLYRTKSVTKNATGGNRNIEKHLHSIDLDSDKVSFLYNKDILIIDDVCTSGNSLLACYDIVVKKIGSNANIECFAFSKTIHKE